MKNLLGLTAGLLLSPFVLFAADTPESGTAITIYSTARPGGVPAELYRPSSGAPEIASYQRQAVPGYAVVKQERDVNLESSRSSVRFSDVAAQIDPTTVSFASLTDPSDTRVLEQSFQFDLVSSSKLLERYIDRELTLHQTRGSEAAAFTGTLLSTAGGLILRDKQGGIQIVNGYSDLSLPELPGGLITRPTLVWDISTKKPGPHRTRVTYQTGGVTWWADYNLLFSEGKDENSGILDVGAWVSILNQSGASYADAKLKLVAGDVHRAEPPSQMMDGRAMMKRPMAMAAEADAGFEEKGFFEYHLYTLGRPTSLPDRSTKQIELFPPAQGVPCEKVMVYYGLELGFQGFFPNPIVDREFGNSSNKKVDVYLRFKNSKDQKLGLPLPAGRIRVSKKDPADGSLELIGEDTIDHTPKDEKVLIKLGNAFDVVGERRQTDFKVDADGKWVDEEIEIKVRNHKTEPVTVIVRENLYRWTNWTIRTKSHEFTKIDARTIEMPVRIERDGEAIVRYSVHYSW